MADTHTASVDEANAARLPLGYRDQCSALLIPLNKCRKETLYAPWKCEDERANTTSKLHLNPAPFLNNTSESILTMPFGLNSFIRRQRELSQLKKAKAEADE
ncbi:hypothetical protein PaG_06249 [Moesziomyces aphidis]|uniref:NADH dehydrogenase [ubiquinone] 1 beta subcomplex subunit 7 n=1 Tax=Moesziomyces aphidis TaxID=84754 RepID=W3VG29_MOEAP|nr:hypothetical protein PaG_06249 [Moesziomyces aphidis]